MRSISAWLILAILLVLITNTIALVGVSRNRAGAPIETIELTERELPLQSMGQDNSGIGLLFAWHRISFGSLETQFTREQLEGIGFDLRLPAGNSDKVIPLLPRPAYVVLEYDGQAYRQWVERWNADAPQRKQDRPNRGPQFPQNYDNPDYPQSVSRLFPIDAGRDPLELRRHYPEQGKYLIVSAVISAHIENPAADDKIPGPRYIGFVQQVQPSYINVPLPYSKSLALLQPQTGKPPRYTVTLSYGRNLEPWVTSVTVH